MLCPNCKKTAFPIELRCLKCDSILPGVPLAFESPENRMEPAQQVSCRQCRALASDARIACPSCHSTLPRPFSLVAGDEPETDDDPRIDQCEIICADEACEECKKAAGKPVSRSEVNKLVVPVPTCRNPICWCTVMGYGSRAS